MKSCMPRILKGLAWVVPKTVRIPNIIQYVISNSGCSSSIGASLRELREMLIEPVESEEDFRAVRVLIFPRIPVLSFWSGSLTAEEVKTGNRSCSSRSWCSLSRESAGGSLAISREILSTLARGVQDIISQRKTRPFRYRATRIDLNWNLIVLAFTCISLIFVEIRSRFVFPLCKGCTRCQVWRHPSPQASPRHHQSSWRTALNPQRSHIRVY